MGDATRLERSTHVVRGDRAELRVEDGCITVTKGSATQAHPTQVTFGIDQVRHATLRRPSRGTPGWLHVAVVDGSPTPPSELAAAGDPYTLPLTTRGIADARKLVRLISDHVRQRGLPSETSGQPTQTGPRVVLTDAKASEHQPRRGSPTNLPTPATPPASPPQGSPAATVAAASPAPPDDGEPVLTEQLQQLAELHQAGALSEEEFTRAKRRLLPP